MDRLLKIFGMLMLGALVFSSCSKQKYTASFTPSKSKRWVKVDENKSTEADNKSITTQIKVQNETHDNSLMASNNSEVVSIQNKKPVKNINEEVDVNTAVKSGFTKAEMKQTKRELRKQIFKQAKKNLFRKKSDRPQTESNILYIILALFPILCLISIYLYQGQAITNDFWLDLLLHITLFGEIIYALLVVLDVISIA